MGTPSSSSPCQAWRSSCGRLRTAFHRVLDRVAVAYIRAGRYSVPDGPLPERARLQLPRLRVPVALGLVFAVAIAVMQTWCALKGWLLLAQGVAPECQPLHHWLLGYCVALTMLPFCFAIAGPLVVWWAANGGVIRSNMSDDCKKASPELWFFVDQVLYLSLATCVSMLFVSVIVMVMRRRISRIQRLWGPNGPAEEAVLRQITTGSPAEVPEGHECTICLDDTTSSARWRSLPCGHVFHESCLVQWLQRAHRCPLCRLDLHAAYLDGEPNASPSAAPAQQRMSNVAAAGATGSGSAAQDPSDQA